MKHHVEVMKSNQDIRQMTFPICYFHSLVCFSKAIFALCIILITVQSSIQDMMALSISEIFISEIRKKWHQRVETPPHTPLNEDVRDFPAVSILPSISKEITVSRHQELPREKLTDRLSEICLWLSFLCFLAFNNSSGKTEELAKISSIN